MAKTRKQEVEEKVAERKLARKKAKLYEKRVIQAPFKDRYEVIMGTFADESNTHLARIPEEKF